MDAISGTRRQVRELVDGTLEVRVHVDPRFKQDFHRLFPNIDSPVALAPLASDFEQRERAKGGAIAQWLGARCREPVFRDFLAARYGGHPAPDEAGAAAMVREICGVPSRAEIDGSEPAAALFEAQIRKPFVEWLDKTRRGNAVTG